MADGNQVGVNRLQIVAGCRPSSGDFNLKSTPQAESARGQRNLSITFVGTQRPSAPSSSSSRRRPSSRNRRHYAIVGSTPTFWRHTSALCARARSIADRLSAAWHWWRIAARSRQLRAPQAVNVRAAGPRVSDRSRALSRECSSYVSACRRETRCGGGLDHPTEILASAREPSTSARAPSILWMGGSGSRRHNDAVTICGVAADWSPVRRM
jgi:hypothetical protein